MAEEASLRNGILPAQGRTANCDQRHRALIDSFYVQLTVHHYCTALSKCIERELSMDISTTPLYVFVKKMK